MRTRHVKLVMVIVFALTLGAGVVAGLLASRLPAVHSQTSEAAGGSPLAAELGLTSEQREKMKQIWVGVQDLSAESLKLSQKAARERDDAIRALIPQDKVDRYNKILQDNSEFNARLEGKRRAVFDKAVKQTNEMLTPEQREKYSKILKSRLQIDSSGPVESSAEPTIIAK